MTTSLYVHDPLPSCRLVGEHPMSACGMFKDRRFEDAEDRRREKPVHVHSGGLGERRREYARLLAERGHTLNDIRHKLQGKITLAQLRKWGRADGWLEEE